MGYLLKEALKTLCGVNQWSYAVFWKIGDQNPKLLIWEECYYEAISNSRLQRSPVFQSPEPDFGEFDASWASAQPCASRLGFQDEDKVHILVRKMMMDNHFKGLGEGLIGRAACTGNHQWILLENYKFETHPSEVQTEVYQQFSNGMQTVAVIPVLPHGVVQLASSSRILENLNFVNHVKSLVAQLGCVLLSYNCVMKDANAETRVPVFCGNSVSMDFFKNCGVTNSFPSISECFNQESISEEALMHNDKSSYFLDKQIEEFMQFSNMTFEAPEFKNTDKDSSMKQFEDGVAKTEVIYGKSEMEVNERIALQILSGFKQRNGVGQTTASNLELSQMCNSPNTSDGLVMHLPLINCGMMPVSSKNHSTGPMPGVDSCMSSLSNERRGDDLLQPCNVPVLQSDRHIDLSEHFTGSNYVNQMCDLAKQNLGVKTATHGDDSIKNISGDDLFDILGADFKNKLLNGTCNDVSINESIACNADKYNSASMKIEGSVTNLYTSYECNSGNEIFSVTTADHLLDAVVSGTCSTAKTSLNDSVSSGTTLTNVSGSSICNVSQPNQLVGLPHQFQGEQYPNSLTKPGAGGSCAFRSLSFKENSAEPTLCSSIYGSQITSWFEPSHDRKQTNVVSTAYSKKPDQGTKSTRKRLKPGENPRPRPKDRQMIQDRVKELREIVPNGAKCSIDALLERTIKHMLFLQSITKHADKLKQNGETKVFGEEGGLKDNFERGATWAYEVGSQSMLCPIRVEDLNAPRQMLVEMLCEEQGLFLEIADIIRGLGLTILKGILETCNDKIWARFSVEAERDVTRMEIFMSLVRLFDQSFKGSGGSMNCFSKDSTMPHYHQTATVHAAGGHCGFG